MSGVGDIERKVQTRLLKLSTARLGYDYLGNWEYRADNSNIEIDLLRAHLARVGYSADLIAKALHQLQRDANDASKTLYQRNRRVYELLRYGVKVKPEHGQQTQTVWLVDWNEPRNNSFSVAEEVAVSAASPAAHNKRPDVVFYVNGIALVVLELKRSTVSVSEGIRQNLDNQKKDFIEGFFSTVQIVLAGNDTEGLRYAPIQTPEKYWLTWKEEDDESGVDNPLDRAFLQTLDKERLLELIHDFVVYDAGIKKLCRPNQFFGVKAAQKRVRDRRGGIIWHTQGSGKSLTMVWLAKWIKENIPGSRILIITDRDELDKQIEKVFKGVEENVVRAKSGKDLVDRLNKNEDSLICTLIHKFGSSKGEASAADVAKFAEEILANLPKGFKAKGDVYVFVDEAHRTQSGELHKAMRILLPDSMLIGFTGTPLLSADKARSIETFGSYIHTYKYDQAVRDGVVLDLRYEARDVDQRITSQTKIDDWFALKTANLNDNAKAQLKAKWGNMRSVTSSKTRLAAIVQDIVMDMNQKTRLANDHGNAILVASSVYEACKYYDLFADTELKGKVAIITSYTPDANAIKGEEVGEGETDALEKYDTYKSMLASWFNEPADQAVKRVEEFEEQAKRRFIEEPGQLKLLIVVDKLLTGFDAPSATYLYIDKQMRDHGLFQAICRVNRLDGDDKEYGYIVDYKDLFKSLEKSVEDYTSEAFDGYDDEDVKGLLEDRLTKAKQKLDDTREQVKALCEPVLPPKGTLEYIAYFTTDSADAEAIATAERNRLALYRMASGFARAYAEIANEMLEAGYTAAEGEAIKKEVAHYEAVRQEVKIASGDAIDLKAYEPGMRYLIDTYIKSDDVEKVSDFDDLAFLDLFVKDPQGAVDKLPKGLQKEKAAAAVIEKNIRKVIVDENPVNPRYYEKMSQLLAELVRKRHEDAISYKEYLAQMKLLAQQVKDPGSGTDYPVGIDTRAKKALFDQLDGDAALAESLNDTILSTRQHGWRTNRIKRKKVENAVAQVLEDSDSVVEKAIAAKLMELIEAQDEY